MNAYPHHKYSPFIFLCLLLTLGLTLFLLTRSTDFRQHAASLNSLEAEAGVLTGNVTTKSDTSSSGGSYVLFGSTTSLKPTCTDSLQTQINNAAPGTTLKVRTDCIYRESVSVNKSLTLDGQGGAEIRGSDVWGNTVWQQSGNYWISTNTVPVFYAEPADCQGGSNDAPCHWPEQVFLDGRPLQQVATSAAPLAGQFNLTSTRQIRLVDNPTNHIIEVTMRTVWLYAYADNVTVKGFTMKHSANAPQSGGIRNYLYAAPPNPQFSDMTIENNVLSDAHGDVVSFINGSNNKLLNNEIFHGGDLGVGLSGSNPFVQGNKIHDNNTEHFSTAWEAGGVKSAGLSNATFDSNEVYNNDGPGLWCDVSCQNITYSNNKAYNNQKPGIFFEISNGAKIFGNTVWNNGFGFPYWGWGAGILISSSSNAEVYNNTVAWSADGIVVLSQCRTGQDPTTNGCLDLTSWMNNVQGNYIHNNTIILVADTSDVNNNFINGFVRDILKPDGTPYVYMYSTAANNHCDNNKYWIPQPEGSTGLKFVWGDNGYSKLSDFNATPAEENGTYLTDTEKNQILQSAGIPLTQPPH